MLRNRVKVPITLLFCTIFIGFVMAKYLQNSELKISVVALPSPSAALSTTSSVVDNATTEPYEHQPVDEKKIIAPIIFTGKYRGEFSFDLHGNSDVKVGSKITLDLPEEDYMLTVNDIYLDENRYIYEFIGEDGSDSLLIYFPDSGESYLQVETRTMSFESNVDSNGVGEFYNLKQALLDGEIIYDKNDYVEILTDKHQDSDVDQ